jgi:predicted DNA-binding transcriptional regulator AlpA
MSDTVSSEWLSAVKVSRLLSVSAMTIWRWERNEKLAFPKPVVINTRKYWNRNDLDAWMRKMIVGKVDAAA